MKSLTLYEIEQIRKIAGWKAEPPSYVSGILEKLTHPLVKLAEKALPPKIVAETIQDAYASSEISAHREKVLEKAGVSALHELWKCDLATCDRLADQVAHLAEEKALLKGAGSGGGNLLSAVIVVRALMSYCLQTIHTIGYCYGFGTEEPHEREYVLGIMLIASAGTLEDKLHSVASIGKVTDLIVEEVFEIVKDLNTKEKVTFLLAEQNTNLALRYSDYGYILENGRIVMDGLAKDLRENEDVKEFYLGMGGGDRKSFKDVKSYKRRKRWLA